MFLVFLDFGPYLVWFVWFCIWRWPPLRCRMLWPAWPWRIWWHSRANVECLQEPQVSCVRVWHTGRNEGPRFDFKEWLRDTFLDGAPFGSRCNGGPRTTMFDVCVSLFVPAQETYIWSSWLSIWLCYFDGEHDCKKLCIWVIQCNVLIGDFETYYISENHRKSMKIICNIFPMFFIVFHYFSLCLHVIFTLFWGAFSKGPPSNLIVTICNNYPLFPVFSTPRLDPPSLL